MKELSASIRLRLSCSEDFSSAFGPGTAQLLRGIEENRSLNQTSKDMGMAYSKAWKALKKTEQHLRFELIERHGPKGSTLTKKGKQMLELYDRALDAAVKAAQSVLDKEDFICDNKKPEC